jgi:nitroreductase
MTTRTANARVVPLIVERSSPRAYDASEMPQADLDVILEAAGLAPSAHNYQPWRFLYAHRADEALFAKFLSPLVEFNQMWASKASVLVFVISDENMTNNETSNPNHSHSFDAGAAWALLALQATALGYRAHGMTGVDFEKAREVLDVPAGFRIEAAVAIGRQAPAEVLPERMRGGEAPSGRKPVSELAFEGTFPRD